MAKLVSFLHTSKYFTYFFVLFSSRRVNQQVQNYYIFL